MGFRYILAILVVTIAFAGCDSDQELMKSQRSYELGNSLHQTNYGNGNFYTRYAYTGERVTRVERLMNIDNSGIDYFDITYQSETGSKIKSIKYSDRSHVYDTLEYDGDNLTRIISTFHVYDINGNLIEIEYDTTDFTYSRNFLKTAQRGERKIEFSGYKGENFTRVKYYMVDWLQFDITLKYDSMFSPFDQLGYLGFVHFNNNYLEGMSYLTYNNIVEYTEVEPQGATTYQIEYIYDFERPITSSRKRLGSEYHVDEYFIYNL